MAEVTMPQLGETVTEGTITRWFKQVGDTVAEDEVLFEVSTDKVDSEVPSPIAGVLTEILVPEGDTVEVGRPIAVVSADGAAPAEAPAEAAPAPEAAAAPAPEAAEAAPPPPAPAEAPAAPAAATAPAPPPPPPPAAAPAAAAPAPAASTDGLVLSPIVRRLMSDHGLTPSDVTGSGVGGRITRGDVERTIQSRGPAAAPTAPATPAPAAAAPAIAPRSGERETSVPLSKIRLRTGEHMVGSKATSPHTFTAVEVDYEAIDRVRTTHRNRFKADEGFSLTYLPFIARAVIDAIAEFPHLNATVGGDHLTVHNYVNLSVAVDLDYEGLLAPVVRDADQKRLRAIAREVRDLADRARSKQLSADDIVGGTFTLTNMGSYGTHFVLPVINQPQVGIISTDGISRKPVVVTAPDGSEAIAIHSVGILAMSWDHRAFDGAYAAAFMARVKEILETRDWEAEL
jgi:2-oxoglutarate dehydrogenase E2 component (dihydrolipoamide succinyltransferase)